jgi:CubicO group peptidase (beta-lactamase class C family)
MNDTRITLSTGMRARLAPGHDQGGAPYPGWDLPTLAGAGALRSTMRDMLKFAAANVDATEGLSTVFQTAHVVRRPTTMPDMSIGLAWHVRRAGDSEIVWHNGGTGGYHSFIGFDKKARTAVVMLHNSVNAFDDVAFHLLDARVPLAPPPAPAKVRQAVAVPPAVLDAYVGEYELAPTFSIVVTHEGDALFIQATGQGKLRISAESETEFFLTAVDAQITFVRDAAGRVTGLVLHQNGRDTPGKKR